MHQFYGRLGRPSELRILDSDAVCALIPNLVEPSCGLDVSPVKRIGESYIFHFDPDAKPKFKYLKRIGNEDPRKVHARIICENETRISCERGLPPPNEKELLQQISEIEGIPLNLTLAKYAFAFPFGNYAPANLLRVHGEAFELVQPVRSHDPSIPGYIVVIDHEKVQKGARNVFNMLRESRGFTRRDVTFIQSCISRRLAEIIAGCTSNTECQIFKEALSSSQVCGFLAYGELSFTHLLQEPFVYNFSCWGLTLRSVTGKDDNLQEVKSASAEKELIQVPPTFTFKTKAARLIFNHLVHAFIEDYMKRRLFIGEAGWRSLVQIAQSAHVSFRSVYGSGRRRGSAISELERRGLIETRIFTGKRGRGGKITKARIQYEREPMKRYVDAQVART